ncbi:hypothetical protein OCEANICA350_20083 [Oceanicaulis sp. 350]|nr:hypothetical protein OCEANICA350_20083 [Oceanicaulis sp. 350]
MAAPYCIGRCNGEQSCRYPKEVRLPTREPAEFRDQPTRESEVHKQYRDDATRRAHESGEASERAATRKRS